MLKNKSFIYMAERILLLSPQQLKMSNVCSHTYTKTHMPLNCIVNDALVHFMPSLQQMLLSLFMIFNRLNALH